MSGQIPASPGPLADRRGSKQVVATDGDGHTVSVCSSIAAIDRAAWNGLVDRSQLGTVFHRHEWLTAIETGLGYPACHLVVEKDTNLIGLFPNFVVDLPKTPFARLTSLYPGFGGPLVTTDVERSLELLLGAIPERCDGRTIVHEIRAVEPNFLRYDGFFGEHGYTTPRSAGRFQLTLTRGYDRLFDEMDSSKRRAIRRARETDYEIVEEELTPRTLQRFYRQYARHMRAIEATVFPLAFLEALTELRSHILLVTLRVEGEYAGGFLELLDEQRSTVHSFLAGVPSKYFEYYASELLHDYLIRWAIDNGYDRYDFGGAGGDFRDGVFAFKEGFGGELVPNLYWERGTSPVWPAVKAGRSLYWRYGLPGF